MAKHTTRDKIRNAAMELREEGDIGRFSIEEARERAGVDASDKTIRDTLNSMADQGWLSRTKKFGTNGKRYWRLPASIYRETGLLDSPRKEQR